LYQSELRKISSIEERIIKQKFEEKQFIWNRNLRIPLLHLANKSEYRVDHEIDTLPTAV
jgi:hypothetical protein